MSAYLSDCAAIESKLREAGVSARVHRGSKKFGFAKDWTVVVIHGELGSKRADLILKLAREIQPEAKVGIAWIGSWKSLQVTA